MTSSEVFLCNKKPTTVSELLRLWLQLCSHFSFSSDNLVSKVNIYSFKTFSTFLSIESYFVAFSDDKITKFADVDEDVFTTIARDNKSKSFLFIEEFYGSSIHVYKKKIINNESTTTDK